MIINGHSIAEKILARTKARAERLSEMPRVTAIVVQETPATKSYISIKSARAAEAGCAFTVQKFDRSTTTQQLHEAIKFVNPGSIIVQLPLPEGINTKDVCAAIPINRDADVLSSTAREKFEKGETDALLPPVTGAVREILAFGNVELKEKTTLVIGDGWLVGNPCATWLRQQGAEVSVLTLQSGDLHAKLIDADIIISGAGSPHLIHPSSLKPGVVLIDAGTSESNSAIVGDADPACAEVASLFTPVPGGVGPIAVACLFENVVTLAERAMNI